MENRIIKDIERTLFVQVTFINRNTKESFVNYFVCDSYMNGIKEVFKAMKRQGFGKEWRATFRVLYKDFRLAERR